MQNFPNIYTLAFYICEKYNPLKEDRDELLLTAKEALQKEGAIFPDLASYPGKEEFTLSALGYTVINSPFLTASANAASLEKGNAIAFAALVIKKDGKTVGDITFYSDNGKYFSSIFLSKKEVGDDDGKRVIITDLKKYYDLLKELAFPFAGD